MFVENGEISILQSTCNNIKELLATTLWCTEVERRIVSGAVPQNIYRRNQSHDNIAGCGIWRVDIS